MRAILLAALLTLVGLFCSDAMAMSSSRGSSSSGVPGMGRSGTSAGGMARAVNMPQSYKSYNDYGENTSAQVGRWFMNRWWDLIDIADFSVGVGPGFLVHVRATKLAQAIGGWSESWRVGFRGRSAGVWKEKRKEAGISLLYYQRVERERIAGWIESMRAEEMDLDTAEVYGGDKDRSFTGVGFTVHAGILVDVNLRPMQAVDFVLGLMTIDVLDDDHGRLIRNKDL